MIPGVCALMSLTNKVPNTPHIKQTGYIGLMNKRKNKNQKNLTPEQTYVIEEAFKIFDKDGSGSIDYNEFKDAIRALGTEATNQQIKDMIKELDVDNSGAIEFDEFLEMMRVQLLEKRDLEQDMEKIFEFYSTSEVEGIEEPETCNYITIEHLKKVREDLREDTVSDGTLQNMIKVADKSGVGKIYLDDFKRIMRRMRVIGSRDEN